MISIRSLQDIALPAITEAFNHGFSDYFIDVSLTPELLAFKISAEDIDLDASVGAFEDGKLVGLILHGNRSEAGIRTAYNAGTAVRPTHRRQGLVREMYAYALPRLRAMGFHQSQLEVIDINAPALNAYLQVGFEKTRRLEVFSGQVKAGELPPGFAFRELPNLDNKAMLMGFWDYAPTWQHAFATAENTWERQKALGVFQDERLCAYAIFTPFSGRVLQFAVSKDARGKGIGKALFSNLQASSEAPLRVVNVEELPDGPGEFLHHIGMRRFLAQWEMRLQL